MDVYNCVLIRGPLPLPLSSSFPVAVTSTVKQALQDSLVQILQPKRRVDILRDVMEARAQRRPFVVTFCGVNGVGKSTNLAKVWPTHSFFMLKTAFKSLT